VPPRRRVAALLRAARIVHPFPTLLNVAATAGLAGVAARGAPDASTLVRMLALMFCAQCAIGVANDYVDRDLDAATKPWKPIAAGLVRPLAAAALALALIVAAGALAATLGAGGFGLAMAGMGCGLVYDIRLKRTAFSALPYMVAIPVLPIWVWLTLGAWQPVLWWLLPLGALIGLALHLANTLPDLDGDRAHGVAGLAHRLGARRSMLAAWASFGSALALSLVLAPFAGADARIYLPALVAGCASLAASVAVFLIRRDELALQLGFGTLAIGSAVLAVGWLAAVT
jgi:4-hydroxybenzoate polyprenyltransferase